MSAHSNAPRTCRRLAGLLACAVALLAPAWTVAAETGDLPALRSQALDLVNAARREHGRQPLTLSDTLDRIAQDHAEDMLARGYYAHVSPEGQDARDRYLAEGGDKWQLVAENIATCSPCAVVPDARQVAQMQRRWMDSPHHRENILSAGITQFGFGVVAGARGPLYAVQTFAGPGTPRGGSGDDQGGTAGDAGGDEAAAALAPAEADDAFVRAVNARRQAQSLPPLQLSEALSTTAAGLLPDTATERVALGGDALTGRIRGDWASVAALAGSCGGCGAEITGADIDHFLDRWLDDAGHAERLLGRGPTALGFALRAYGDGRKVAVAVLGTAR